MSMSPKGGDRLAGLLAQRRVMSYPTPEELQLSVYARGTWRMHFAFCSLIYYMCHLVLLENDFYSGVIFYISFSPVMLDGRGVGALTFLTLYSSLYVNCRNFCS